MENLLSVQNRVITPTYLKVEEISFLLGLYLHIQNFTILHTISMYRCFRDTWFFDRVKPMLATSVYVIFQILIRGAKIWK